MIPRGASFALGAEQGTRHQSQDGAKWRKRATVEDMKTGPKEPRSTVLTEAEEAAVVAFRRHTLLPLDDCLYALQPSIPHLTRSALHRWPTTTRHITLDLSRFCAAPSARLSAFRSKATGLFQPSAECRRRGL